MTDKAEQLAQELARLQTAADQLNAKRKNVVSQLEQVVAALADDELAAAGRKRGLSWREKSLINTERNKRDIFGDMKKRELRAHERKRVAALLARNEWQEWQRLEGEVGKISAAHMVLRQEYQKRMQQIAAALSDHDLAAAYRTWQPDITWIVENEIARRIKAREAVARKAERSAERTARKEQRVRLQTMTLDELAALAQRYRRDSGGLSLAEVDALASMLSQRCAVLRRTIKRLYDLRARIRAADVRTVGDRSVRTAGPSTQLRLTSDDHNQS
jgi:hypothetical protein